ncbi:MAG: TspO/MBR family protein [Hyphomicrobiaceae bacterium]
MTLRTLAVFAVFALLTAAAATTGAQFMPGPWYAALAKPDWTPPNWLFGPVWTLLYVMIAVAGALAWRSAGPSLATLLWLVQMVANTLWSYLFFGLNRIDLALADITLLWLAIVGFVATVWNRSRTAALLFVPYLLWVSFAAALNLAVFRLN